MPAGMLLRSNGTATGIAELRRPALPGVPSVRAPAGAVPLPFPLEDFIDYGRWVQRQVAPDVDAAGGSPLGTAPGFTLPAATTARACPPAGSWSRRASPIRAPARAGACRRTWSATPPSTETSGVPRPAGARRRPGAERPGVGRADARGRRRWSRSWARRDINWLHGGKYHRRLGRTAPLVYAPTDVGPLGLSRLGRGAGPLPPAARGRCRSPLGLPRDPPGGRRLAGAAAARTSR